LRIAILDLGTNTFHLLIADISEKTKITILFKSEKFVRLGEESISHIGEAAFRRGIDLLNEYRNKINEFSPEKIFAFGTAALRRADNADDFIRAAKDETQIDIHRISGDEEAELICFGVRQAIPKQNSPFFIMDIGGGSTEFILSDTEKIYWKKSFPLGASVLLQQFHHHDPMAKNEIERLNLYLEKMLQPLFLIKNKFPEVKTLVGASGSFDSFASMTIEEFYAKEKSPRKNFYFFQQKELKQILIQMQQKNLEERLDTPGMLAFRAEMISVAAVLTEFVIGKLEIEKIYQSAFALKEGVLWKLMNDKN
jgi:exopolyphosphatase / guanosine-5'-triphosphate,3'-diphosphate pyrophosphatase